MTLIFTISKTSQTLLTFCHVLKGLGIKISIGVGEKSAVFWRKNFGVGETKFAESDRKNNLKRIDSVYIT